MRIERVKADHILNIRRNKLNRFKKEVKQIEDQLKRKSLKEDKCTEILKNNKDCYVIILYDFQKERLSKAELHRKNVKETMRLRKLENKRRADKVFLDKLREVEQLSVISHSKCRKKEEGRNENVVRKNAYHTNKKKMKCI